MVRGRQASWPEGPAADAEGPGPRAHPGGEWRPSSTDPGKVSEVQKVRREPISLHTPLGRRRRSEFGDLIEDSEAIQP